MPKPRNPCYFYNTAVAQIRDVLLLLHPTQLAAWIDRTPVKKCERARRLRQQHPLAIRLLTRRQHASDVPLVPPVTGYIQENQQRTMNRTDEPCGNGKRHDVKGCQMGKTSRHATAIFTVLHSTETEQAKPGPHRTRQRCSGPVSTVRARPGPFRPVKTASRRPGGGFDGTQGRNSADRCGEDRASVAATSG